MRKLLYILCLLPFVAQAETLSLDSCISMALENNKTLQSSQMLAEKYEHEVKAYWANFFPNFKLVGADLLSTKDGYMGGEMMGDVIGGIKSYLGYLGTYHFTDTQYPIAMGADGKPITLSQQQATQQFVNEMEEKYGKGIDYKVGNILAAGLVVEQPIYMGGKVLTAWQMAKMGKQMAEQGAKLSSDKVIVAVQEAYALAVRATEMHKVAVKYDSLLQSLLVDVQNAEKHGLRGHNDVLKVQVKVSEAELQIRQAENGIRLATMNLCHYIGLPLTSRIDVDLDAFGQSPEKVLDPNATINQRPEFSVLDLKSEIAAKKVKLAKSEFLPQVAMAASVSYMKGFEVAGEDILDGPGFGVMLNVKIPLYHANEGIHKVKSARLEAERVRLEQEELVEKMSLELAQAANNLDEAYFEVELAKKSLVQSEDNLRSSNNCYNAGTESLSDLLEAQTLWQQAYAKLANAKANLFVAATKYKKASGNL